MNVMKIAKEVENMIIKEGHSEYFNGNDLVRYYAKGRLDMINEELEYINYLIKEVESSNEVLLKIRLKYLKAEEDKLKEILKNE